MSSSSSTASVAGAGSVWNAGNWHWESKNYNKIAEEAVRARLRSILIDDARHAIRIVDIPSLKAEASIHIRKGKKVPMFDISFTCKWEGRSILGATAISTGDLVVADLMPDDIDDDFPVRVTCPQAVTSATTGAAPLEVHVASKILATGPLVKEVRNHMREFVAQIVTLDGGPDALIADAARRAEEKAKTEEALVSKAEEKNKIAREQTIKEKQRKVEETARAKAKKSIVATESDSSGGAGTGAGSSSNTNATSNSSTATDDAIISPLTAAAAAITLQQQQTSSSSSSATTSSTLTTSSSSRSTSTTKPATIGKPTTLATPTSTTTSSSSSSKEGQTNKKVEQNLEAVVEHAVRLEGKATPAGAAPEAKASVWNTGAWQWEAKEFTPWAKSRLIELLVGIDIDVPGGHVKVAEVSEVTGDATINIRKGRKIVIFELSINAKWEGELMDGDGRRAGTGDGEIVVTDLDQDHTLDTLPIKIKAADDGGANDKQLSKLFNKWGMSVIKKKVWQFVEELNAKE